MKQVTVISGKGGTGKTSLVASLAHLAQPLVAADCDVDAANLAILMGGLDGAHQPFFSGHRVSVDLRLCQGAGACAEICHLDSMRLGATGKVLTDPFTCDGCGACLLVCDSGALTMHENIVGVWTSRPTSTGMVVHAMLGVAQDNSGELVTRVRQEAITVAASRGLELIIVDGPPGIGQPVRAAVEGADLVVAISEPSSSGEHDLQRALDLARRCQVPALVVVNKADLEPDITRRIQALASAAGAPVVGCLDFDPKVPRALARRELPMGGPNLAPEMERIWGSIQARLGQLPPASGFRNR